MNNLIKCARRYLTEDDNDNTKEIVDEIILYLSTRGVNNSKIRDILFREGIQSLFSNDKFLQVLDDVVGQVSDITEISENLHQDILEIMTSDQAVNRWEQKILRVADLTRELNAERIYVITRMAVTLGLQLTENPDVFSKYLWNPEDVRDELIIMVQEIGKDIMKLTDEVPFLRRYEGPSTKEYEEALDMFVDELKNTFIFIIKRR